MSLDEKKLRITILEESLIGLKLESEEYINTLAEINELKKDVYSNIRAWDKVQIARSQDRLKGLDLLNALITSFVELKGDQYYGDDKSIVGGIGYLDDIPVTIIAQVKGKTLSDNLDRNFGMTSPEGFRKALRLAKQAEKFKRPIITIVDTSGAYPGKKAEERGQARAIANSLMEFSSLETPVIAIVLSEGGSGGALALTISDHIMMMENAIYSILSPEGLASILFKDTSRVKEVSEYMKLTSQDLYDLNIIDEIIAEPLGGIKEIDDEFVNNLKSNIKAKIKKLLTYNTNKLLSKRYEKYRKIGALNGN